MSEGQSVADAATVSRVWRKPPAIERPWLRYGLLVLTLVYLYFAVGSYDINWERVSQGMERGWKFISAFAHPDFVSRKSDFIEGMTESIIMTVTSTVIGIIISIPIALGAASNLAPVPIYLFCRAIIALSRALHEIIVAILMVAIFGFGPLAEVITLSFATIGFLSKLLAEDIEAMDKTQAEAIKSTGASWLQWINYAVQPQVMPRLIGLSIYRLDINFRESAVLGLVGAGGIGATLNTAFDRYEFDTAAAIIITIIVIVMILEYSSSIIRGWLQ